MRTWVEAILDAAFPRRCGLCDALGPLPICDDCRRDIVGAPAPLPLHIAHSPLAFAQAVHSYEGRAAQAVRRLKYHRITPLSAPMADDLRGALREPGFPPFDAAIPVPIHWRRLYIRGFNQSDLLTRPLGVPIRHDLLRRIRATRPQVGLSREERLRNLQGAFRASPASRGMRLLLVDDVTTSGGTALACAGALRDAGAAWVGILAYCGEHPPTPTEAAEDTAFNTPDWAK